jgi:hypothetical protein
MNLEIHACGEFCYGLATAPGGTCSNEERKESEMMRLTLTTIIKTTLSVLFLVCSAHQSSAQQGAALPGASAGAIASGDVSANKVQPAPTDTRYRIGPGDVLDIRVARAPELSRDSVRVDQTGMIRMPMLDVDIQAACLTDA